MDDSQTLKILDPWTMIYLEYEQEFIKELQREIGPEHPFYRRDVFAIAVRRDPDAVIFQTADDEVYAIIHLNWKIAKLSGRGLRLTMRNGSNNTSGCEMTDPRVLGWCSVLSMTSYMIEHFLL
jgi:hypothetical protein